MNERVTFAVSPGGVKHQLLLEMLTCAGFTATIASEEDADAHFYITPRAKDLEKLKERGITAVEYLTLQDFKEKNGILTAEAALAVARENTDFSICSARTLVIGSGCIALPLISRLKACGAFVTVAARNTAALNKLRLEGISTCELCFLEGEFDLIFNTVPSQVLSREVLSRLNPSAVIIDLASLPGGLDTQSAEERGFKVVQALALPGKYMPRTAAKIIFDTVSAFVRERKQ